MSSPMRCCTKGKTEWRCRRAWMNFARAGVMLTLLLWTTGCGKSSQVTALDLPIYFTCDTHGRLEPCGCFVGQFGGLSRLKTVFDSEAPAGALRVDVGDAAAGREDYDLIEYR